MLDPAAQDSGMCPTCEVMPDFLSSPGSYAPLTCRHRRPGNRQEDLMSAWFTSQQRY
jgi:hypothetical protein